MIGTFSLLLILAGIGIIGAAFWIWKSKTNWSTLKKVIVAILIAAGLIAIVFALFIALLAGYQGGDDRGVWVEEINKPLNKFEYAEITEAELQEHPAIKNAVTIEEHRLGMNGTEWEQTQKFLETKWSGRSNEFVIDEKDLEEELNKSTITIKMRNIFESEGYPIPENSYIRQDGDRWYVVRMYYLFSITDPEVEKQVDNVNVTTGKKTVPIKLKSAFNSSGFSLPEDAGISGKDGRWVIDAGTGYTIMKEDGKLNVYTGNDKTHEIRKDNGKLKIVYIGAQGSPVFKVGEKYYRFEFWVS